MRNVFMLAGLLFIGILFFGCTQNNPTKINTTITNISVTNQTITNANSTVNITIANATGATSNGTSQVGNAITQFGTALYSKLDSDPHYTDQNIFFSPYSISTALAMAYEGARGQTADEMQSVFNFPTDNSTRRASFASIYSELNRNSENYSLKTGDALWVQKDYPILTDYFNVINQYYGGEVTNLDFIANTEGSRSIINDWVANQTNNKITDLIPQGGITPITRLVITNAIYFKGMWANPYFNENNTTNQTFMVNSTESVQTPMMTTLDTFNYTETDNLQILELPYSDSNLSMLILLPKSGTMPSLEESLNLGNLSEWKGDLTEQKVQVYLPKFEFRTKYDLTNTLEAMGMPTAFSNQADFSGMTGSKNLTISEVAHEAYIDVNEEGTEAAAATAVIMVGATAFEHQNPIPVFRADHPFIFLIQDNENGAVLFLGRVSNPASD